MPDLFKIFNETFNSKQLMTNVSMKEHTSFKIGGNCDLMVFPHNVEDVVSAVRLCKAHNIPYYILGNGSNLLVKDKGFRGVMIKISNSFSEVRLEGNCIYAQAGASLSSIANIAKKHSLTGFEFASGIPGTLGGAICMNAGAYDGEIKNVLESAQVLTPEGNVLTLSAEDLQLGYRSSVIPKMQYIVLSAKLVLKEGSFDEITAKMSEFNHSRKTKQPLELPSAGSTFKRPTGYFAGKLIMDCNLAGFSVGSAQVSPKHCGFVVNTGNATAADVLELIEQVKERVFSTFGVMLEPEIKVIGE